MPRLLKLARFMPLLFAAVVIGCLLAGAAPVSAPPAGGLTLTTDGYYLIEPARLAERLQAGDKMKLVDVRELVEYRNDGHIPGVLLIPLGTLSGRLKEFDPEEEITVICRSGGRSAAAAIMLAKAGFKKVNNLAGGMTKWKGALEFGDPPIPPALPVAAVAAVTAVGGTTH